MHKKVPTCLHFQAGMGFYMNKKTYIKKKGNGKKEAGFSNLPFCMSLWALRDVVRQWERGGSRLKSWQNTLVKADLHVNNLQQWFSFPKCVNFPPHPSAQFLRCYEDWCYEPSQDGQITGFSLFDCQITVKLAFLLTIQACLYEVRSHTEYSLKTEQIILSFYIYPLRSGHMASGCRTVNVLYSIWKYALHVDIEIGNTHDKTATENHFLMHIFCAMSQAMSCPQTDNNSRQHLYVLGDWTCVSFSTEKCSSLLQTLLAPMARFHFLQKGFSNSQPPMGSPRQAPLLHLNLQQPFRDIM